jgi:predicted ester cyclase
MATEVNKALPRRAVEEVWNQGNTEILSEIYDPSIVVHEPTMTVRGLEEAKQFVLGYLTAFPDLHFTIEDMITEGDRIATRWSSRGTHTGMLQGIAPTGKQVTSSGITISRHANGKIVEEWVSWDNLGLLQQLGVIPSAR